MEEDPIGWTDRQKLGFEYSQNTPDLPRNADISRHDNFGSIEFHGKSKQPPEIEIHPALNNLPVIYYDADSFLVTLTNGRQLDLNRIISAGWKQKYLALTSPRNQSPEIHDKVSYFATIDTNHQEVVIGGFDSADKVNVEDLTQIALWNTLVSRFISEVGIPVNNESTKSMMSAITERRQQVFDVLTGKTPGDVYEIATAPFTHTAPVSQQSF